MQAAIDCLEVIADYKALGSTIKNQEASIFFELEKLGYIVTCGQVCRRQKTTVTVKASRDGKNWFVASDNNYIVALCNLALKVTKSEIHDGEYRQS